MKITVMIHHLPTDKTFSSDEMEFTEEDFKKLELLFEKGSKLEYFKMSKGSKSQFFPNEILKESVLTIWRS